MFRPRVIPCLLLKNGGLVKTVQFQNPRYIGDPINAVKIFNDLEADELVFLDIDASKENRIAPLEFVKKVGEEAFMPFAVGGGIKSIDEIKQILNAGAEKVVINTHAINNPNIIKESSDLIGSQSIIVSIDAKKINNEYVAFTCDGTKNIGLDPVLVAKQMEKLGAGEILINSIDKDGMMDGYDIVLIKRVSNAVKIPVVAMGGASGLNDLRKAVYGGGSLSSFCWKYFYLQRKKQRNFN